MSTLSPQDERDTFPTSGNPHDRSDAELSHGPSIFGLMVRGAVRGIAWVLRRIPFCLRATSYIAVALYSVPLMINLMSMWRYKRGATKRLVIRSYDRYIFIQPVIVCTLLFDLLYWAGASKLLLGYLWGTLVVYTWYTMGRNVRWNKAFLIGFGAIAVVALIGWATSYTKIEVLVTLYDWLHSIPVEYAPGMSSFISVLGGFYLVGLIMERHLNELLIIEGNTLTVKILGEKESTYQKTDYHPVFKTVDINEGILAASRALELRAKDPAMHENLTFEVVPGLRWLSKVIADLLEAQTVKVEPRHS